jgi:glycerol-3-phosphate dehydrogenase
VSDGSTEYDVVVVGGGITGAGIARDAALRGLSVALFEKNDYGSGTSSKSSKMIHGGLRYLEHGEFGLVFESVSERRVQSTVAPHLVRPLPFLIPIFQNNRVGLETMNLGLWIYDTLALFRAPRMHKTFRGGKALKLEPLLKSEDLRGALEYYDCFTDDARLVLENVVDAAGAGADCHSHTEVLSIEREREGGRVSAVIVRDRLTGAERRVPTRAVLVAAGPWTDEIAGPFGIEFKSKLLRPTKGVHLVFPHERLPLKRAVTIISPVDDRVMFAIPWRGRTVIGTTDTDFEGTADEVHADFDDVAYLCDSANAYFPSANFTPDDVIATWAGLRPLVNEDSEDESDVSREHEIFVRGDGVLLIAGGKLTTYRLMAKEMVREAIKWLRSDGALADRRLRRPRTKKRPLPGAAGLKDPSSKGVQRLTKQLVAKYDIAAGLAEHLAWIYGVRADKLAEKIAADRSLGERLQDDLPYVWAEVDFAVERDLARTVDDVLSRRVPLLLVGRDQGLDVVDAVARRVGDRLGWSETTRAQEIARYQRTVNDSRKFRRDRKAVPIQTVDSRPKAN